MTTEITPLYLAQEVYCNLFKDVYGVKPRNIDPVLWNDITWVEAEIKAFCAEPEPKQLGYFEEILANMEKQ